MSETIIGVSFNAGEKEYGFTFQYNITSQQWIGISKTDYDILVSHIDEQIKLYKKEKRIIEPTEPGSMEFAPHFYE